MISLKEIGRICGVSESTVSKALKNHPKVSEETKRLVREVAERNGYHPNAIVRSLQSGRSMTIGVIHTVPLDNFYGSILRGIHSEATANGYDCLTAIWGICRTGGRGMLSSFAARRVDAILLFPRAEPTTPEFTAELRQLGVPVAFVDCMPPSPEFGMVTSDNIAGAILQTEHLISRGLKRIGCLYSALPGFSALDERLQGYAEAMRRNGLPADPSFSLNSTGMDKTQFKDALKTLLTSPQRPEGIVCNHDYAAVGILAAAQDLGLKMPETLSVVGFGNIEFLCETFRPRLTSVDQSPVEIGIAAARLVLDAIANPQAATGVCLRLPVRIVERDSVRQAAASEEHSLKEI